MHLNVRIVYRVDLNYMPKNVKAGRGDLIKQILYKNVWLFEFFLTVTFAEDRTPDF